MTEVIHGPLWSAVNWAIDEGAGSIHDDKTAENLGFRGGTVPGDVHMNQFPPVLMEIFGKEWFEKGNLSLNFKFATVDKEKVQVFAEKRAPGADQVRVWMERDDGTLICTGTASVGDHNLSELRNRDLRPCDPSELRILNKFHEGLSMGGFDLEVTSAKQEKRLKAGHISDPLDWYGGDSPWGGPVACPSTYVEYLWGPPTKHVRHLFGSAVGLFGAIEIGNVNGPFLLNRKYHIESKVVSVGQSPQTEYFWFDSNAANEAGDEVATFRMMIRVMKASSPEYQ